MTAKILTKLFPDDITNNIIMWECYIRIAERNKNGWTAIHKQFIDYNYLITKLKKERLGDIKLLRNQNKHDIRLIKKTINTIEILESYSLW